MKGQKKVLLKMDSNVSTPLRWAEVKMPFPLTAQNPQSLPGISLSGLLVGYLCHLTTPKGVAWERALRIHCHLLPADLVFLKQNWPFIAESAIPRSINFKPKNKSWNEEENTLHLAQ